MIRRILGAMKKYQILASSSCNEEPLSSFSADPFLRRSRSLQSFKKRKLYTRSAYSLPSDVRAGYFAVYVGQERQRFVIKTHYLSHPLFKVLLEKVEEEYGFHYNGGIHIPCEVALFEHILCLLEKNDRNIPKNLQVAEALSRQSANLDKRNDDHKTVFSSQFEPCHFDAQKFIHDAALPEPAT